MQRSNIDAEAYEDFMSELMQVEMLDLEGFTNAAPEARLNILMGLQSNHAFIQLLREHKNDGISDKFLRDSLGNQDKLVNQLRGTLLSFFVSSPTQSEAQANATSTKRKSTQGPGVFQARPPSQMTLEEAKGILKNKPTNAKSYKLYVDVAHQFQEKLKGAINNEYLALSASNHFDAAKRLLTSGLAEHLTDAELLGIYMNQAENDDFVNFAIESTAIKSNALLKNLADSVPELFKVMRESTPELTSIYQKQAKEAPSNVSHEVKKNIKKMRAVNQDPYTLLGLNKNATDDEIKKAYRKKSLSAHPDKGGTADQFALVQKSYNILSNPAARQYLDKKMSKEAAPAPRSPRARAG